MNSSLNPLDLSSLGAGQILDALADGAYVTDSQRRILFWNRAASRITGWGAPEVVGRSCSDNILMHVDKDGHRLCGQEYCPLHRAMVTGEQSQEAMLVLAQHRDGHRVPVEVSVAPIRDLAGAVVGGIEVFRDCTAGMEDLRRAKVIQDHSLSEGFVGDSLLEVKVLYTPQELVGGDFYRVEQLGEGRYALLVADVMGHGVASALYTMQLRVLWDDAHEALVHPAEFMAELNRRLVGLVGEDGYFATAVLAVIDVLAGTMRCVRAGHPSPVVLRSGRAQLMPGPCSPALGLSATAVYREHAEPMGVGDRVVLYSDGAIEVTNAEEEELGAEGLCRLMVECGLGRKDLLSLDALERRLLEFSNQIRLPDDLTLLAVQVKGG